MKPCANSRNNFENFQKRISLYVFLMSQKRCGLPKVHNSLRLSLLHQKHRRMATDYGVEVDGFDLNTLCSRPDRNVWEVKSASRVDVTHRATLIRPEGCRNCQLKCRFCNVCPHLYLCTCEDSSPPCKHVHFIHRYTIGDMSGEEDVNIEYMDDPAGPDRECFIETKDKERKKNREQQRDRSHLEAELRVVADRIPSVPDSMLPMLREKISELRLIVDLVNPSTFPVAVERDVHQKMEKQMVQFPKKRKKKSVPQGLAGCEDPFEELENVDENVSRRICSMAECEIEKKYDDKLVWITCDVCGRQFHFICVGKFIGRDGVLVCKNCTKTNIC